MFFFGGVKGFRVGNGNGSLIGLGLRWGRLNVRLKFRLLRMWLGFRVGKVWAEN